MLILKERQSPIELQKSYNEEDEFFALLRKLYCMLWFQIQNNTATPQEITLFGGFAPAGLNGTASAWDVNNQAYERYVSAGSTATGAGSSGMAVDTIKRHLWVTNQTAGTITVINIITRSQIALVTLGGAVEPVGIAFDGTNKMYVACTGDNTCKVVSTDSLSVTTSISVGGGIDNITSVAYNPTAGKVYVGNRSNNEVVIIQNDVNIGTIAVGSTFGPQDMGVNPVTNKLYTLNTSGGSPSITPIDCDTDTAGSLINFTAGNVPQGICYHPILNLMYVAAKQGTDYSICTISSADQLTEDIVQVYGGKLDYNPTDGNIYVVVDTLGGIDVVNRSNTILYRISGTANPSRITRGKGTANGPDTIFVNNPSVSTVQGFMPAVTIDAAEGYEVIRRDSATNPIIVKHTHVMYGSAAAQLTTFNLVYQSLSGYSKTQRLSMSQWKSAAYLNSNIQDIFNFNDVLFDGRQSLQFTLAANANIYICFYYIQANIIDLVRKKLLA